MYLIADNIRKIRKPLGIVLPVLPQLFLFLLRYIVRICSVTVIIITAIMIAVIIGRIRNTLRSRKQLYNFLHAYNAAERLSRAYAYRHGVEHNDLINTPVMDMLSEKPHISIGQPAHVKPLENPAVELRIRNIPPDNSVIRLPERIQRTAVKVRSSAGQIPVGMAHSVCAAVLGGKADTAYLSVCLVRSEIPHMAVAIAVFNAAAFIGIVSAYACVRVRVGDSCVTYLLIRPREHHIVAVLGDFVAADYNSTKCSIGNVTRKITQHIKAAVVVGIHADFDVIGRVENRINSIGYHVFLMKFTNYLARLFIKNLNGGFTFNHYCSSSYGV